MPDRTPSPALRLSSLHRYPGKSMRGEALGSARVAPWGLEGDRRWMVVEAAGEEPGRFVSAREAPALLRVLPEILADSATDSPARLRLSAPGLWPAPAPVEIGPAPDGARVGVRVWRSQLSALAAEPAADAWLSAVLDRPVRLVHLDDPRARLADADYAGDDAPVSFADGYPLLLTTEASLAALDALIADGAADAEALSMQRFRPNVVVDGSAAWEEDDWRRVRIGGVAFEAVKGCARCVITTHDPADGTKGREPLRSLARERRFDGGLFFGVNLVPDLSDAPEGAPWPRIGVGDDVVVERRVEPGRGPLRAAMRDAAPS